MPVQISAPVPPERADRYRASGLWDDQALRDGIEAAARAHPQATAVVDNERTVTWAELADLVGAGVRRLAGHERAAVLVAGNTISGLVAYHALLRSGATTIVLDRRCGDADLAHAIDVAGPGATVVAPRERAIPAALHLEWFGESGEGVERAEPDRDAAALVLFTSGTTSRPKGVIHSLNTLTAGARNLARITGGGVPPVFFLVSPLTSIAGIMQLHFAADQHAPLVLEDRFDPSASLDRINATGATALGGAPVIVERLLRAAEARPEPAIGLRQLALGGAMLPTPLLELAADRYGMEVARVYGSSEAPNATGSLPTDGRDARLVDDGALMPGTEVRVGSRGHPQECLLRGPGVFLGYVDPADNAACFEDGWFRTGDAVELADGRLTVVGRLKEVVHRNGLKISLPEIEAGLADLPGAVECACFGVTDDETGERLVVALRPVEGAEAPSLAGVTEHLRERGLAERKLPEELVVWADPLPRTASGKIVRSRLVRESSGRASSRAPRLTAGRRGSP